MKKILLSFALIIVSMVAYAQNWAGTGSTNPIWRKGAVGIGAAPSAGNALTVFNDIATLGDGNSLKFQLSTTSTNYFGIRHFQNNRMEIGYDGGTGFGSAISIRYTGRVGIGITPDFADISTLSVGGNTSLVGDGNFLYFKSTISSTQQFAIRHSHNNNLAFGFDGGSGFQDYIMIRNNGKVGIGVAPSFGADALLSVDGTISSEEIVVEDVLGADFVFENDYDLRPLDEVEAYVKANKHLPEIAPAKEMQEEGLELGEMSIKLLQKVEELTLYLIEQKKKIEELEQEVAALKEK